MTRTHLVVLDARDETARANLIVVEGRGGRGRDGANGDEYAALRAAAVVGLRAPIDARHAAIELAACAGVSRIAGANRTPVD